MNIKPTTTFAVFFVASILLLLKPSRNSAKQRAFSFLYLIHAVITFFALSVFNPTLANEHKASSPVKKTEQINDKLHKDYALITAKTYRELTKKPGAFTLSNNTVDGLIKAVDSAEKNNDFVLATALIEANKHLLKDNVSVDTLQKFANILLRSHAETLAQDLLQLTEEHNDGYAQGRIVFEMAKYYAEHNQWPLASNALKSIDLTGMLPKDYADEAFIILGAALQQKRKHRESLSYYNRIKPDSKQYRIAQLNVAIAYIRQDWWTDAKIAIDSALQADPKDSDGLTNRLYTVLGFSQLQNGFYRNARETFRKVQVKSSYSNRALLGLGMSALHQEDFVGALNAFNHLKDKNSSDISVMESYLLAAFTLEQLKQAKTAADSYSESIHYYEQKINQYSALRTEFINQRNAGSIDNKLIARLNSDFYSSQPQLVTLTEKINRLHQLLALQPSNNQKLSLQQLNARLTDAYVALATRAISKRQETLNSYLSQSRFGLAKLYDSP